MFAYFYVESFFSILSLSFTSKRRAISVLSIFVKPSDHNLVVCAKLETSNGIAKKERPSAKIYFIDKIFARNCFFYVFLPIVVDIF